MITIENGIIKEDSKFILVTNYFVGNKNEIVNWYFNEKEIKSKIGGFDIGVWKIKQLKK